MPDTATLPKLLTEEQAAEFLNIRPQTLSVWRCCHRHGLPFTRVGRSVRYRLNELEKWLEARTVRATTADD